MTPREVFVFSTNYEKIFFKNLFLTAVIKRDYLGLLKKLRQFIRFFTKDSESFTRLISKQTQQKGEKNTRGKEQCSLKI